MALFLVNRQGLSVSDTLSSLTKVDVRGLSRWIIYVKNTGGTALMGFELRHGAQEDDIIATSDFNGGDISVTLASGAVGFKQVNDNQYGFIDVLANVLAGSTTLDVWIFGVI